MPSIDELIALPLEELRAMVNDEARLLETYKDCFRIEAAAIDSAPSTDDEEATPTTPKVKKAKKPNAIASLKLDLFNMAELEAQLKQKIAEKKQQSTTTTNHESK